MADPWAYVAEVIDERRLELGYSWKKISELGGPSESTLEKLRKHKPIETGTKRAQLCSALGLPPDGIERLLAGQTLRDLVPAPQPAQPTVGVATEIKRLAGIQAGQTDEIRELRGQIEGLEGQIGGLESQIAELRSELRHELSAVVDALRASPPDASTPPEQ